MTATARRAALVVAAAVMAGHGGRARAQPTGPASVAHLIATIDDDPDVLHGDITPAVTALCGLGLDGAIAVAPLLDAPTAPTRMHAGRALACAVARWLGYQAGDDDGRSGARRRFEQAWRANGAYNPDAAPAARQAARARWTAWLAARRGTAPPLPDEPATADLRAALRSGLPAATACAAGHGRVWATVTFGSSGALRRVRVVGARGAVARCVERAFAGARVPPFTHRTTTFGVSVSR